MKRIAFCCSCMFVDPACPQTSKFTKVLVPVGCSVQVCGAPVFHTHTYIYVVCLGCVCVRSGLLDTRLCMSCVCVNTRSVCMKLHTTSNAFLQTNYPGKFCALHQRRFTPIRVENYVAGLGPRFCSGSGSECQSSCYSSAGQQSWLHCIKLPQARVNIARPKEQATSILCAVNGSGRTLRGRKCCALQGRRVR